ncbi:hypothetical protein C8Q78DRAFT_992902 [Trametes maxima]|nr:hypothetical protein C8Q78DRAFT_1106926 [Trametes maxima]KAI0669288.1 hypothetical protein C8Q78DRAFT_992902 [Trametes maxima]
MFLQIHHSQYGGRSLPAILNDLQGAYEPAQATGAPRITSAHLLYSDFVRWTRQQYVALVIHGNTGDALFGVVNSSRSGDLAGVENIVGPCIVTLPFPVRVPPSASLRNAPPHDLPSVGLADITKASTLSGSRNIFQVPLTVEIITELDLHVRPVFGADIHGHRMETDKFPLGVAVFLLPQNRGFNIDNEYYDSHYLSFADVHWFQSHLLATLDAIVHSPTTAICIRDIDIISDGEHAFLKQVGIGLIPDLTLASESLVHRFIGKPHRPTHTGSLLSIQADTLTYADLDGLASRTSRVLGARGASLETPIPMLFKDADQPEAVVAIVATMKVGAVFVCLDVS